MSAVVLVGMSVREDATRDELAALAATRDDCTLAFLQLGEPSLPAELTRLAGQGCPRIVLVGVCLAPRAIARSWLRRVAAHWKRERTGPVPELVVAPGILRAIDPGRLDALVVAAAASPSGRVSGTEASLESPGWEDVPGHRHHVLVCRGPRCTARGSDETAAALGSALGEAGLGDDDVLVAQTGCLFPCNHAPLVVVHPDDVWYGRVGPEACRDIVEHHLLGGRPVQDRRLARSVRSEEEP
ncbi:(2Fe-2S) ferredoxin domain-containing protein [Jiangella endophytica]|uniref:(2Fe-2S) ferredoxin domain-containing protein n=1 Tax=Jiangella endophytica TaxID=1623398 RepID=UPI000E351DA1|nr:(2Fe-2S) ferredoxin domain-containing protein [Jiangella endophytica]